MYTVTPLRTMHDLQIVLYPYYQSHTYYRELPYIRLNVKSPTSTERLTVLFTLRQEHLNYILGISVVDIYKYINQYISNYLRTLTNDWDMSTTWIPQFVPTSNGNFYWEVPAPMTADEQFFVDTSFVPFSDPAWANIGASPNLGYMFGLGQDPIGSTPFASDLGLPFPSNNITITPKQPGDVKFKLVDNNHIIDTTSTITGDGSYDVEMGVLQSCLRKPVPVGLFSLSLTQPPGV